MASLAQSADHRKRAISHRIALEPLIHHKVHKISVASVAQDIDSQAHRDWLWQALESHATWYVLLLTAHYLLVQGQPFTYAAAIDATTATIIATELTTK